MQPPILFSGSRLSVSLKPILFIVAIAILPLSFNGCGQGFIVKKLEQSSNTPGPVDPGKNSVLFAKFQKSVQKNCNSCHTSNNSPYPGIADFTGLRTSEDWINHPSKLVIKGNLLGSKMYNRLRFASDSPANTNMPFAIPGIPDNMTQEDADDIVNYINSLKVDEPKENIATLGSANKVKMLVSGLPLSNGEINDLRKPDGSIDETKLKTHIKLWIESPQGEKALIDFFKLMFQQNDLQFQRDNLLGAGFTNTSVVNNAKLRMWRENLEESFARTAVDIVLNEGNFTDVISTRRHAVTSALLSTYRYIDNSNAPSIRNNNTDLRDHIRSLPNSDFRDWRFIQLTRATSDNPTNYDQMGAIRAIANDGEFELLLPRIGFFNTLAFQIKWQTNDDNNFRVTTNQTLIASLGKIFEAGDTTAHGDITAVDEAHAPQGSACFQCHRLLDPMKEAFRRHYNSNYRYPAGGFRSVDAYFAFQDYRRPISNMGQLANAVKSHPFFADAWVGKICSYANSRPCDITNSEFQILANSFRSSNFNFKQLLIDALSSPLITREVDEEVQKISITRQTHFCRTIETRYNAFLDSKSETSPLNRSLCTVNADVRDSSSSIPDDENARGSSELIQSPLNGPINFQSVEKVCKDIAEILVRDDVGFTYADSGQIDASLEAMVRYIMGLSTAHPRYASARSTIQNVYNYASGTLSMSPEASLKESFVLACSSPDLAGMGL